MGRQKNNSTSSQQVIVFTTVTIIIIFTTIFIAVVVANVIIIITFISLLSLPLLSLVPTQAGIQPRVIHSQGRCLNHSANETVCEERGGDDKVAGSIHVCDCLQESVVEGLKMLGPGQGSYAAWIKGQETQRQI